MSTYPGTLQLVETDPSRFDELDVARLVAKLGGTMRGRQVAFPDSAQLSAALDVLSERFGSRFFRPADERVAYFGKEREMIHAR